MKKMTILMVLVVTGVLLAGCNQVSEQIPPANEETLEQDSLDQIRETGDDEAAADTALEATDQALEELDNANFGEAPGVDM